MTSVETERLLLRSCVDEDRVSWSASWPTPPSDELADRPDVDTIDVGFELHTAWWAAAWPPGFSTKGPATG